MQYPEIPITKQQVARSAFTDGFLLMLLNYNCEFHDPGYINW